MTVALIALGYLGLICLGVYMLMRTDNAYGTGYSDPGPGEDDTRVFCGICNGRPRTCSREDCPWRPGDGGSKGDGEVRKRIEDTLKCMI